MTALFFLPRQAVEDFVGAGFLQRLKTNSPLAAVERFDPRHLHPRAKGAEISVRHLNHPLASSSNVTNGSGYFLHPSLLQEMPTVPVGTKCPLLQEHRGSSGAIQSLPDLFPERLVGGTHCQRSIIVHVERRCLHCVQPELLKPLGDVTSFSTLELERQVKVGLYRDAKNIAFQDARNRSVRNMLRTRSRAIERSTTWPL